MQAAADAVIRAFGHVDVLINNAGVAGAAASEDLAEDEWDRIMDINLKGTFLCCQSFGRHMLQQMSGKIVNVSSSRRNWRISEARRLQLEQGGRHHAH